MIDGVASVLDVVDNIIDVDVVVGVGVLIVFGVGDVGFELLRFSVLEIAAIIVAADVFFNLVFAFVDAVDVVVVFEL